MNITPWILFLAAAKVLVATTLLAISSWGVANAPTPPMEFTTAEKAYIETAGPIKMCVDPDWAPFERINSQGQHEGIAADLIQLVARRSGLQIELHPVKDWDESLAASKGNGTHFGFQS